MKTNIIVSKFGGSSIAKPEDIEKIRQIVSDDPRRRIIVVSAPGKRHSEDIKVTDMLIELAKTKNPSLKERIIERYRDLNPNTDIGKLSYLLQEKFIQVIEDDKSLASIKAFGEEACARLIAEVIGAKFIDAKELFLVSNDLENSKILPESEEMIKNKLQGDEVFVVPGFYGATKDGFTGTFSRGGSDLSGAYIAAALNAQEYENFTDKDGILAADPEMVSNPKKIEEMTFGEIRNLAYSGFKIFHEEAMISVSKKRIPVHIRSTLNYPDCGTYIVSNRTTDKNKPIVGVAYKGGLCAFDIAKFGLNSTKGIARKILQVFEEKGISVEHMPTGIDEMSVIFRENQLTDSPNNIGELIDQLHSLIGESANIFFQENLGSLVVAGKAMNGSKGLAANLQLLLAEKGINIRFISQGPSEECIIYGVDAQDGKAAVNIIYENYLKRTLNNSVFLKVL